MIPNTKYYDGISTGFGLSSISIPGTTMSAAYSYAVPVAVVPITFFSDGFEGSAWLTTPISGTSAEWSMVPSGTFPSISPHSGSKIARFNSYDADPGDQARLYLAAGLAIPASYDTIALSFWMYHDSQYINADSVQVQVSTNNGVNWTNLGAPINRYDGTDGWAKVIFDLSAYRGQSNVQIGFLGTGDYGNDIYLDDISVSGYNDSKALIGTANYYQSLTDAYAAASSGNTIKALGVAFIEDLLCGQPKNIILDGGYDIDFLTNTGYSVLNGKLTIRGGSLNLNRLIIR
jgi:fermentation-respiration switch protein FrsA (DUF1100 family)